MKNASTTKEHLIVGEGVEITGKVDTPGTLELHGRIIGEVRARRVQIGTAGRIEGRLIAEDVELSGYASDFVSVTRKLTVRSTATLVGQISYRNIEIDSGASIRGKLEQQGADAEAAAAPDLIEEIS